MHLTYGLNASTTMTADPERYYGFSKFSTELNEKTGLEGDKLAPSDSRLRPDQLAMEVSRAGAVRWSDGRACRFSLTRYHLQNGDIDRAEELKKQLEEKQRTKRKEGKLPEKPTWFVKDGEGWKYNGQYCECLHTARALLQRCAEARAAIYSREEGEARI